MAAYTKEELEHLEREYSANPSLATIQLLSEKLGRSKEAIKARLARSGLIGRTGAAALDKRGIISRLADLFGLDEAERDSLTKAKKSALEKILAESLIDLTE